MTYEMLQYLANDESLHKYGRKYALGLNRLFPIEFPLPAIRGMVQPYNICNENRAALYKFYQHMEIESSLSIARRARVLTLLGKLAEFLQGKSFERLTKEDVQALITRVRQQPGWSITTQNYHLKAFRKFLKFLNGGEQYPACISWFQIKERRYTPIKKEDLITEEEMAKILQINGNPMHRCLFALLWEGLRIGEIGNLRCKNITFEGREVYISVKGKTGERTVLSITGTPFIRQWLDFHPTKRPDDWLFVISSNKNMGKRMGYPSLRQIVRKGCEKAGITGRRIHPHVFRHSSITDRRRKGMRQREATAFYGVSGNVMTQVYDHLADTDVHNEIRRVLGIEKMPETQPTKIAPKVCAICKKINAHYATNCLNCGNALTTEDALKQRDQFQQVQEENQHIKSELTILRGVVSELMETLRSVGPEKMAQIFQKTKNQLGESNHE
jgi:site-specific recombinase XerD